MEQELLTQHGESVVRPKSLGMEQYLRESWQHPQYVL